VLALETGERGTELWGERAFAPFQSPDGFRFAPGDPNQELYPYPSYQIRDLADTPVASILLVEEEPRLRLEGYQHHPAGLFVATFNPVFQNPYLSNPPNPLIYAGNDFQAATVACRSAMSRVFLDFETMINANVGAQGAPNAHKEALRLLDLLVRKHGIVHGSTGPIYAWGAMTAGRTSSEREDFMAGVLRHGDFRTKIKGQEAWSDFLNTILQGDRIFHGSQIEVKRGRVSIFDPKGQILGSGPMPHLHPDTCDCRGRGFFVADVVSTGDAPLEAPKGQLFVVPCDHLEQPSTDDIARACAADWISGPNTFGAFLMGGAKGWSKEQHALV
jgi:hypothetical protein